MEAWQWRLSMDMQDCLLAGSKQAFPDLTPITASLGDGWLSKLRGILESARALRAYYCGGTGGIRRNDFVHEGQRNKGGRKRQKEIACKKCP